MGVLSSFLKIRVWWNEGFKLVSKIRVWWIWRLKFSFEKLGLASMRVQRLLLTHLASKP